MYWFFNVHPGFPEVFAGKDTKKDLRSGKQNGK